MQMTVLLVNTLTQAESLLYSLEQEAGGIGFHVNANKTEYKGFNQEDISALNGGSLKFVDKFSILGKNISSSVRDVNICLAKA